MRVLLSAYACEPGHGSEPGVGWNWVLQAARFHQVWVLTRANNRPAIEAALRERPLPGVHWIFFDLPPWMRFWKRKEFGLRPYYYLWQLGAYLRARSLHRQVGFDVVHHVTFVNHWLPSFLSLLPVPFVWGPVGGGESAPAELAATFGPRGRAYELARDWVRRLARLDPWVRTTARRAAVGLATTPQTLSRIEALGCRRARLYPEAGLSAQEIALLGALPHRGEPPFRLLSVGRLLHWKGFHLSLRAFAEVRRREPRAQYWLAGSGGERPRLEKLARDLGLGDSVRFLGALPRAQLLRKLAECDVFVHPSLHDSGGWVCLEAMAAGRPVICLHLGGPAVQVTGSSGIKVPPSSPEETVAALADAILRLHGAPKLRRQMGEAGRRRVRDEFHWDRKGEWMNELYRSVSAPQVLYEPSQSPCVLDQAASRH